MCELRYLYACAQVWRTLMRDILPPRTLEEYPTTWTAFRLALKVRVVPFTVRWNVVWSNKRVYKENIRTVHRLLETRVEVFSSRCIKWRAIHIARKELTRKRQTSDLLLLCTHVSPLPQFVERQINFFPFLQIVNHSTIQPRSVCSRDTSSA